MDSKLTITNDANGIYVVPLNDAVYDKYPAFWKEVLEDAEFTPDDNPIIKLPGVPPAAILALLHVLQHDFLTVPPSAAGKQLAFLADALLVGTTYHLDRMTFNALQLFREHLETFPGSPSGNAAFAADFVAAVQAAYAPDPQPQKQFNHRAMRVVRRVYVPELKRLVVEYAAERREEMMGDEAYAVLFGDEEGAFCNDVLKAAEMMQGRGDGGDVDLAVNWDDFFGDERFVTVIDCEGKKWVTTRKKASENSKLLSIAPGPDFGSMFGNAIYELPDDSYGIEAMIRVLEDGADTFHVPSRIEDDAPVAVEWLTNAVVIAYKYEVAGLFRSASHALAQYFDRCEEPHAVAKAVRTIFKYDYATVEAEDINYLPEDCLVGYFAERYEGILQIDEYKDLFREFPEFDEGVREGRLKRGLGGEDADIGGDVGVEHGET